LIVHLRDGVMTYHSALRARTSHGPAGRSRISVGASAIVAVLLAAGAAVAADPVADDPRDIAVVMPALNDALEHERSGKDISWTNVATGRAGTIRIERTFYRGQQQPCREYTRTTTGAGASYQVRGTGCRLGKLNWTVEEARSAEPAATASTAGAAPAAAPSEPGPAAPRDAAGRSGDPSGEPVSLRPPRKPAPPQTPTLRYGLPTRSQL
jgi:surface antigen